MGLLVAWGGDGWPVRTRGRGAKGIWGEEGADRWAPSVSDGDVVTGWQASLTRGDLPGSAPNWAGCGESVSRRFSNLNPFFN
jgi:hypothetical protein